MSSEENAECRNSPTDAAIVTNKSLAERLEDLRIAEEQMCNILQVTESLCKELEKTPFVDEKVINEATTDFFSSIQLVRLKIIQNVDTIQSNAVETGSSGGEFSSSNQVRKVEYSTTSIKKMLLQLSSEDNSFLC